MDPGKYEALKEGIEKSVVKLVGPATPEYHEFMRHQKELDLIGLMGLNTFMATHYRVEDDTCVMTKTLTRGYFASKGVLINKEDVFLTAFPKTGSTWLQMILLHAIHDGNVEKVKGLNVDLEIPVLEFPECNLQELKDRPSPRFIKSHLPYSLLPQGNCNKGYKIIYITRNPKDTAVSLYHFYKMMPTFAFVGHLKNILDLFLNDSVIYCPFDRHCLDYWEHRNDGNVLFLKYEDLHKDTFNLVKKVCEFIGKDFTDDQIQTIIRATTFDEMAANPNAHHHQWVDSMTAAKETFKFMRKGKIGDWRNHLDDEMNRRFDEWIENKFAHADLTFDYE